MECVCKRDFVVVSLQESLVIGRCVGALDDDIRLETEGVPNLDRKHNAQVSENLATAV